MSSMHAARSASPIDSHVGTRIKKRRKDVRMTQEKLGEQLGVTFQQVQKYERGANRIGAGRLWELSKVLEVPITYFFEGLIGGVYDDVVAEDEQPPILIDLLNNPDELEMAEAFAQIKSKAVRQQLLELARSFAQAEDNQSLNS